MALVVADRVNESSASTGTGSFTLAGAVTGFQSFNSAIGVGNTTYYTIECTSTGEWECGLGTLTGATTLARTSVYGSSNGGSLVNFSAGTKNVFVDMSATKWPGGVLGVANGGTGSSTGPTITVGSTPVASSTSGRFLYNNGGTLGDGILTAVSASQLQVGIADSASPTARYVSFEGISGATDGGTIAGYIKAPATTGAGYNSAVVFQVPYKGSSGSSQNSYFEAARFTNRGPYNLYTDYGFLMFGPYTNGGGISATYDENTLNLFCGNQLGGAVKLYNGSVGAGFQTGVLGLIPQGNINQVFGAYTFLRPASYLNGAIWGDADSATPSAQTQTVQSVVAGTLNGAGANWTFIGSVGTGSGVGGDIIFKTAPAGASGTSQNSAVTALTIKGSGGTQISGALTYGGVTLSNSVTGTGAMVLATTPTLTGELRVSSGSYPKIWWINSGNGANLKKVQSYIIDATGNWRWSFINDAETVETYGFALTRSTGMFSIDAGLTVGSTLTYGGVTLSASVTGTGSMVLSASPTLTGLVTIGNTGIAADYGVRATNSYMPTGFDMIVSAGGAGGYLWVRDNSFMSLGTNNAERVRISASGNTQLLGTLTYGGVTLSNSVTGTGSMVLSSSPTIANLTTPADANNYALIAGRYSAGFGRVALNTGGAYGWEVQVNGGNALQINASNITIPAASTLTYGGVTLSNAVTGTGSMVLSASPSFTGTSTFATAGPFFTLNQTAVGNYAYMSFKSTGTGTWDIGVTPGTSGNFYLASSGFGIAAQINYTTGGFGFSGPITYGGVTLSNSVTGTGSMVLSTSPNFTNSLTVSNGQGYTGLFAGNASNPGYIAWWRPDGATRIAYMGWGTSGTTNLNLTLESGAVFKINGNNGTTYINSNLKFYDDGNAHVHAAGGPLWINAEDGSTVYINNQYNGNVVLTNGTGKVGIGTSSPGVFLDVRNVTQSNTYTNLSMIAQYNVGTNVFTRLYVGQVSTNSMFLEVANEANTKGRLAFQPYGGEVHIASALIYGGVTLANSVTGTGSMVLSANPTFTGTVSGTVLTFTGADGGVEGRFAAATSKIRMFGYFAGAATIDAATPSEAAYAPMRVTGNPLYLNANGTDIVTVNASGLTSGVNLATNRGDANMTRLTLQNTNRAWSISNYGTQFTPNGALVIADETAGSARFTINTSGNFSFGSATMSLPSTAAPLAMARCWCNWTGGGTTINGSMNVSSITRNGAGSYYVNFTTSAPNTSYSTLASGENGPGLFVGSVPNTTGRALVFSGNTVTQNYQDANTYTFAAFW